VFADALVPSAAAADARRVDFPNFPFSMLQRSRPETRLRRIHRDRQTPFQIWSVMIIPNKPANGVGEEQVFNRSAGLQVFKSGACHGVQGRPDGEGAVGEGSRVLLLIIFLSRSSFALLQEALLGKGLARTRFEISLQAASRRFICNRHIRAKNCRQVLARGNDPALLMRCGSTAWNRRRCRRC
jgi:hypothetical protein